MYGDGFFHGMGGGMWLGPLIMFGLPLLIVVLVVWWLMDTTRTNSGPAPPRMRALFWMSALRAGRSTKTNIAVGGKPSGLKGCRTAS
jgi:hypothetical protein